jgi:hypothetical protein
MRVTSRVKPRRCFVARRTLAGPCAFAVLAMALGLPALASASKADLARARSLYNERQYDQAIEAAAIARQSPETRDAATLVLARAHLERYRERVDPADLLQAREALGAVRASLLEHRERLEYLLALGQALFLEDEFGAAASVFESGVERAFAEGDALGDSMLDWWGSAVERLANQAERDQRIAIFTDLEARMGEALSRHPGSGAASYWVAVALRGSNRPLAAWDAAVAGWVRARLAGERSAALRADLDKLVVQGIIPDRVRSLPVDDRPSGESQLRAEWELLKERWK